MPAIASLEDLRAAQKDLLEAKDLNELKAVFLKWRRIGWKNICKLWLWGSTPGQLKTGGGWWHILRYSKIDPMDIWFHPTQPYGKTERRVEVFNNAPRTTPLISLDIAYVFMYV